MRSPELQQWIKSKPTAQDASDTIDELPPVLRKELLQEALKECEISQTYETARHLGKDSQKWREDMALRSFCKLPQFRGSVALDLPGWNDGNTPTSNIVSNSGLFGVQTSQNSGEKRPYLRNAEIACRANVYIRYKGEKLYQFDWDVWHHLICISRNGLGLQHSVDCRDLLRRMGLAGSGQNITALKQTILRLRAGLIYVEYNSKSGKNTFQIGSVSIKDFQRGLNLISDHIWVNGHIGFVLDYRIGRLFGNREYGLVDWEKRKKLKRNDLAKWLQNYYSSQSSNQQFDRVDRLKLLTGLTSSIKDFTRLLENALNLLLQHEVIRAYWISKPKRGCLEERSICIWRDIPPTSSGEIPATKGEFHNTISRLPRVYKPKTKEISPEQIDLF